MRIIEFEQENFEGVAGISRVWGSSSAADGSAESCPCGRGKQVVQSVRYVFRSISNGRSFLAA